MAYQREKGKATLRCLRVHCKWTRQVEIPVHQVHHSKKQFLFFLERRITQFRNNCLRSWLWTSLFWTMSRTRRLQGLQVDYWNWIQKTFDQCRKLKVDTGQLSPEASGVWKDLTHKVPLSLSWAVGFLLETLSIFVFLLATSFLLFYSYSSDTRKVM